MPLSEHEQRLLEQMEQALYAEDPKFASQMQGSAARARLRRRIIVGAVLVIVGLGLVFAGVTVNLWWGAVGFALLVGGVVYAITRPKTPKVTLGAVGQDGSVREHEHAGRTGKSRHPGKGAKSNKQTLMRRLEDRWDRRRHEQQ
ncbi:MAG: DUF3040 domain-containing protein [Phycicoccus sp.]|nr:DUF3040 domain-containing protein [Phycicoccus sp.]